MKLLTKLLLIVFAAVIGMVLLGGFAVTSLRSSMMQEREQSLQLLVRMASNQVEHYQDLEKSGKLSHDDAQAEAKDAIRGLHVGDNFVFIRTGSDLQLSLVHPDPRKENKKNNAGAMPNGVAVTDLYVQSLQNTNKAVVLIYTKRPEGDAFVPKINALERVPGWDWMVGSGAFVDDIDQAFWHHIVQFLTIGGIVLLVVVILAVVLARGILRQLGGEPRDATESMRRIANGDLAVEIDLKENDSSSLMASLKLMQMKLKNITSAIQENTLSLDEQIQTFTASAKTYAQSKSEEDMNLMLKSIQKLLKIADILGKSVSRFKS